MLLTTFPRHLLYRRWINRPATQRGVFVNDLGVLEKRRARNPRQLTAGVTHANDNDNARWLPAAPNRRRLYYRGWRRANNRKTDRPAAEQQPAQPVSPLQAHA